MITWYNSMWIEFSKQGKPDLEGQGTCHSIFLDTDSRSNRLHPELLALEPLNDAIIHRSVVISSLLYCIAACEGIIRLTSCKGVIPTQGLYPCASIILQREVCHALQYLQTPCRPHHTLTSLTNLSQPPDIVPVDAISSKFGIIPPAMTATRMTKVGT